MVSIRSSPLEILQFYDIASLAGKCLTTPPLGVFGGLSVSVSSDLKVLYKSVIIIIIIIFFFLFLLLSNNNSMAGTSKCVLALR